ncbi:MAG: RraA family protein [Pseudomonadota bacterium]
MTLTRDLFDTLAQWDTPTICNALELVVPGRRGHGFTIKPFTVLRPEMAPIVGLARTARIRAAAPDPRGPQPRDPYYEYIARADLPTVVVIEDLDPEPGIGAFWGEVNTAIHKGLGARGVVTSGSFRDVPDSAPGFQVIGGKVGPSHAHVHVVDFGGTVSVHGMETSHDDLIHADQHGAVVIPHDAAAKLPDAVDLIAQREAVILAAARAEDFDIDKLKAAMKGAAEIH